MALVITLIMLSVTLIMAIAFLAVARRERIAVSTSTDTTVARFASDTGLAAVQAQLIGNLLSTNTAFYDYNLLVSTNYINSYGFVPNSLSPTNVNYDYLSPGAGGGPLSLAQMQQNIANLMFLPRAPVMVSAAETNGRFYLDLNRSGAFEDSGTLPVSYNISGGAGAAFPSAVGDPQWVGILERPGAPHGPDNLFSSRYAFIALPVGESLDVNAMHNYAKFLGSKPTLMPLGFDSYLHNQGVGSWEINLAAFLSDLNTNQWTGYNYALDAFGLPNLAQNNSGNAFDDALTLLRYRYGFNYATQASANQLFTNFPANVLPFDNIDTYSDGPIQFTTSNIVESLQPDVTTRSWAGADNVNRFFTPGDFYDRTKTQVGLAANVFGFSDRLNNAATNTYGNANNVVPTYDAYTFYRMLDQLGTDTLPETGRLNLNYSNAVVKYDVNGAFVSATIIPGAETNLVPWNPRNFFCAAADMLLKAYTTNWFKANPHDYLVTYFATNVTYSYVNAALTSVTNDPSGFGLSIPVLNIQDQVPAFGLGHIPVFINGQFVYSPAVNRLLQLAANIYDASVDNTARTGKDYPSIFRPIFGREPASRGGNVYIIGFQQVVAVNLMKPSPLLAPRQVEELTLGATNTVNVYGLPWIIGAKKDFPAFNRFVMRSDVQITRKLQVSRKKIESYTSATSADFETNQMVIMAITNHIGFSLWNSYQTNYIPFNSPLTVVVQDKANMVLSNGVNNGMFVSANWPSPLPTNFVAITPNTFTVWPGSAWDLTKQPSARGGFVPSSSFVTGTFDFPFLPESVYRFANGIFVPLSQNPGYETSANLTTTINPLPQFELMATNGIQAYILDGNQIIDYVHFAGPNTTRDLNNEIKDANATPPPYLMWVTNAFGIANNGMSQGVMNQLLVSQKGSGAPPNTGNSWKTPPNLPNGVPATPASEAAFFTGFFTPTWTYGGKSYENTNLVIQAPYTPTRTAYAYTIWQANDPLVHSLASDLVQVTADTGLHHSDDPINQAPPSVVNDLGKVSDRYQPWGRNEQLNGVTGALNDNPHHASYNLALKDPLVWGSDNWDFPVHKYPSVGWLGRVHRGTPWQTVYLKATNLLDFVDNQQAANPNVGQTTWNYWTGDFNNYDSGNTKPVQDELLFDLFTAAPNANATLGTLSVNQKHPAAWSAVLAGAVAISNITANPYFSIAPVYTNVVVPPSGVDLANAPVWRIVNDPTYGINAIRANLYPSSGFTHVGDILRVPMLTERSPFINRVDAVNANDRADYDISDEVYEWLPQQALGLLRPAGTPRFVVYTYGQTLKPAPDGTVLGGSYFGLVTNYQVVAESATRAVLSVQQVVTNDIVHRTGPVTNYTTKVESFNVLPPE